MEQEWGGLALTDRQVDMMRRPHRLRPDTALAVAAMVADRDMEKQGRVSSGIAVFVSVPEDLADGKGSMQHRLTRRRRATSHCRLAVYEGHRTSQRPGT